MAQSMSVYRQNGIDYTIDDPTVAPVFLDNVAYSAGQYVKHGGNLYRFTANHAAGAWTGSDATSVTVGGELTDSNTALGYKIPFSYQMLNPDACTDNTFIDYNGTIYTNRPGYSLTEKIYIPSNSIFYFNGAGVLSGSHGTCFSSTDQCLGRCTLIETISGISKLQTVEGTAYVRFSLDTSDKESRCIYLGVNPSPFVREYGKIGIPDWATEEVYDCIDNLKNVYIPFTVQSYDPSTCTDGYLVLTSNGALSEFSGFSATDYIPIGENETFYRNIYAPTTTGSIGVCYNSAKNFIGACNVISTDSNGITQESTLANTAYVRFTVATSEKSGFSMYPLIKPSGTFVRSYGEKAAPDWLNTNVEQTIYNITKNINNYSDTYQNTYSITTNPVITTDTHGWLAAVDENTENETNKTDMTGAIMSMLTSTGYCHLGEGIFYVSGNIDMPDDSMIEGCGSKTIIRLLSSVSNGYAIKLGSKCIVKNLQLSGGYNSPTISETDPVGNRHGIYFKGNADGQEGATVYTTQKCILDGLHIYNFAGGGITCHNTGYSHASSIVATNCIIGSCHAGINISYFSEYHRFTNMMIFDCHYGVINNGGNNIFTACTIQGLTGFLIDNSESDLRNPAHGSCVGCSFNHQANNDGNAIEIYGAANGFVFTGCQIWYGMIYIENSHGIVISSCDISQNETITVVGGGLVLFSDSAFMGGPSISITNNTTVYFDNCYTIHGTVVDKP